MSEVIWYYDEAEGGGVQKVAGLGSYVKAGDFHDMEADRDAQRLRADTAEAELAVTEKEVEGLQSALGDAEQRIAALEGLLHEMVEHDYRFIDAKLVDFVERIEAALNHKPEAGSHE
jgi:multidrug resistance efflux pump